MENQRNVRLGITPSLSGERMDPIVVRPTPTLVCTPPGSSTMPFDWTPFQSPDWSSACPETSAAAHNYAGCNGHSFFNGNVAGDSSINHAVLGAGELSPSASAAEWKPGRRVDEYSPYVSVEKSLSNMALFPESGEAGSVVTRSKSLTKQTRGKYDPLIDPSLTPSEKKKQRRILANRASARRSRQKKKEAMSHLVQREQDLIQERDSALASLNEQFRVNALLRQQIIALQSQVEMYQKIKANGTILSDFEGLGVVNPSISSSAYPFLVSHTSDQMNLMDESVIWN